MKFTRLRLTGFKSFVDPTDLVIADGLTGVVGPNGCGKSNLLEALRWVMGENRPTAMRGGGMEDVIFAGTDQRGARSFAEVSLILDNTDRLAPAAFNVEDTLDVIRRITRDIGSAYKVNGKDVRARDVQMLFADASTGAHSPALVRQGQISELINAKPQKRRRILEEAAGISGLYQRRHEAELRLNAAETNLQRLDDVLEQLASQRATLERQAKQAARYRNIGEALRTAEGQLLYRRWADAEGAAQTLAEEHRAAIRASGQAETALVQARAALEEAEEALPALREEEAIAGAVVQRVLVARDGLKAEAARAQEQIADLEKRLAGLERDRAREDALNADASEALGRLRSEEARLEERTEGEDALVASAEQAEQVAAEALTRAETDLATQTEALAQASAQHQSVTQHRLAATQRLSRAEAAHHAAAQKTTTAATEADAAQTRLKAASGQLEDAQARLVEADAALVAAEEKHNAARDSEATSRAALSEAKGELSTLRAEVSALSKLVANVQGPANPLLDQLSVAAGYEAALGAALGDDLSLPLTEQGAGWSELPGYATSQPLPKGVQPLADHVSGSAALTRRLSQIGIADASQADTHHAALLPGQRLVSLDGDLWRWDGFKRPADAKTSSTTLRLQQINRLQAARQAFEEAEARVQAAQTTYDAHANAQKNAAASEKASRDQRREAERAVSELERQSTQAEAALTRAQTAQAENERELERLSEEVRAAQEAGAEAQAAFHALTPLDDLKDARTAQQAQVQKLREAAVAAQSKTRDLLRESKARAGRLAANRKEQHSWAGRLDTAAARLEELNRNEADLTESLKAAKTRPVEIESQASKLAQEVTQAEARKAKAADALVTAERARSDAASAARSCEEAASTARAEAAAAEVRLHAGQEAVTAAAEQIREALDVSPKALREQLADQSGAELDRKTLEADVTRLKRQRDALGAVNLRAEEDAREIAEEQNTLITEKADLEEAIRTMRQAIGALNKEGRERLLGAFNTVNDNFKTLFKHLFGGGEANLEMVESDDPLEAGLEIMCQPPGKKLATLSLLSGGEQTLTALALIFAVFLANPAPICVLDEVDAPLDDANVTRFCDLLDEMTRRTDTRFLIITHHAITMARMDRLFGVTMAERGVSQLVSVDLKKAEAMVA